MQSKGERLANSHLHPTPRASRGSTRGNKQPGGGSGGRPRQVRSGPPSGADTHVKESPRLDGKAPTARIPMQDLRHDKDRRPDARGPVFQVPRAENRSTESVRAVPLLASLHLLSFPPRAMQQPVLPLHADEITLLQSASDWRPVVPPLSTVQNLRGTSPMPFDTFASRLTDCRSILQSYPAGANRLRFDASPPVQYRKFAGRL